MAGSKSFDCELRLALPGNDEPSTSASSTSRKRSCTDHSETKTPSKTQIVGWPPVQSYRKKSGLFVKVNMDGAPFLRKIDLKAYRSYAELLKMLEEMFKVKIGQYEPSYEDKDGDWMLVGDVPWEMFVSSCKRLRIIKCDEAKGLCL